MKYTKGQWIPYAFGILVERTPILLTSGNKSIVELQNNTEIACAAVNACIKINPSDPLAVAEAISDMYEALKQALRFCDLREGDTQAVVEQAISKAEGKEA